MRSDNLRVERAAVAATELSLTQCAELFTALPVVDHGTDLLAYQDEPFRVARIQVKGSTSGLKAFRQYSQSPMIVSYVLDPLGTADVYIMTGVEAWNLPNEYIARGGRASDHHPDNEYYNWAKRTRLLHELLEDFHATPDRWLLLFDQTASKPGRT